MRQDATPGERRLWEVLRDRRCMGLKFRRQAIVGGFIVDFYCARLKVVIEVDGAVHHSPDAQARDYDRDRLLAARGIRVVRIPDELADRATATQLLADLVQRSPSPSYGEGDRG